MRIKKIKEVEIDGERIYLRKDFLGWRVIHPDKKILGGKRNLLLLLLILAITITFFIAYYELSSQFNDMITNPCSYSHFRNVCCASAEWPNWPVEIIK